jgi:hypothetical protein
VAGAQGSQGGGGPQGPQGSQGAKGPIGPSDARFKKNVEKIESTEALTKIMKMRGVKFTWKRGEVGNEVENKFDIGFIAQEIQNVFPELIIKNKQESNSFLRLKYDEIVSICLGAIKEQSSLIRLSEEKIKEIETKAKEKGLV